MSLEDYKKELENHDWFYAMSEDNGVYRKGMHNYNKLQELSKLSNEHKEAFLKIKDEKIKQILG